jgi:hypothetical protein
MQSEQLLSAIHKLYTSPEITLTQNQIKILLCLKFTPRLTITEISENILNTSHTPHARKTIAPLITAGLAADTKKSRWITQLNAWRIVTVYIITPKGDRQLKQIVDLLCID